MWCDWCCCFWWVCCLWVGLSGGWVNGYIVCCYVVCWVVWFVGWGVRDGGGMKTYLPTSTHPPIRPYTIHPPTHPSIHPPTHLFIHRSIHMTSIHPSIPTVVALGLLLPKGLLDALERLQLGVLLRLQSFGLCVNKGVVWMRWKNVSAIKLTTDGQD